MGIFLLILYSDYSVYTVFINMFINSTIVQYVYITYWTLKQYAVLCAVYLSVIFVKMRRMFLNLEIFLGLYILYYCDYIK